MFSNKEDKNILFIVIVILAVSLIALAVLLSIIWRLVSPSFNFAANQIQSIVTSVTSVTSNFQGTGSGSVSQLPQGVTLTDKEKEVAALNLNYNFEIPNKSGNTIVEGSSQYFEEIYNDPNLGVNRLKAFSASINLQIPKIDFNSNVLFKTNSTEALQKGMYLHNASFNFNEGEMLFLCTRKFFNSNNPLSCYYLDLITLNDVIILNFNNQRFEYKVTKLEYINQNYQDIYKTVSSNKNQIRIVTTGKIDQGRERLVITAIKQ